MAKKRTEPVLSEKKEKPTPAYLRPDYPFQAVGDPIDDMGALAEGQIYEIKCSSCEMSIRSQGQNIQGTLDRLKDKGCIGCGNKDLKIYKVDMSKAPSTPTTSEQ